jgi:hypothetical protein
VNIDGCKSYATRENLDRALEKLHFKGDRHVVVWNSKGRCTAIFPVSNIKDGNILRYSHYGFMTIG